MSHHQDWNQVTIRGGAKTKKKTKTTKTIASKYGTPNSGKSKDQLKKSVKEDTGDYTITRVSMALSKQIQQARTAKGLSQKALAQNINVKSTVISEYESGKAIPNSRILSQISKVLGVTLKKSKTKKN